MVTTRRLKPVGLISGVLVSGVTLLAWTMPWFATTLGGGDEPNQVINVTGETAAPALAALGLAGLALIAALAIAGPLFRLILGALQVALGLAVAGSALGAIADPVTASASLVTETTGISGAESVAALITSTVPTAWPVVTVIVGVMSVVVGIFVVLTSRRWPAGSSRYQAVRYEDADAPRSAVSDWDSLSDGSDPTSR